MSGLKFYVWKTGHIYSLTGKFKLLWPEKFFVDIYSFADLPYKETPVLPS